MKIFRNLLVFIVLIIGFTAYGQDDCSYRQLVTKIDSISKAKNIEIGEVKILFVTNTFDKTDTDSKSLTKKSKYRFDKQFLVIDDKYFNINKLLYFYIKDDVLVFFFQGY